VRSVANATELGTRAGDHSGGSAARLVTAAINGGSDAVLSGPVSRRSRELSTHVTFGDLLSSASQKEPNDDRPSKSEKAAPYLCDEKQLDAAASRTRT
jgi:hypothetical protein